MSPRKTLLKTLSMRLLCITTPCKITKMHFIMLYQLIWYTTMPRKEQGWITFQSSVEERQILEQICQETQRTKTEILRELIRQLGRSTPSVETETLKETLWEDLDPPEVLPEATIETPEAAGVPALQLSARNVLQGTIKQVVKDTVSAEVTLTIAPGVDLVSLVTRSSADKLGLAPGQRVFAVIKSNSVMIAKA